MGPTSTNYKAKFGSVYTAALENMIEDLNVIDIAEDPLYKNSLISDCGKLWNANFPFQFMIVSKAPGKKGGYRQDKKFPVFTLPIPPESLMFSQPIAINTSATLGGVIEEHNGSPFRQIVLSGTTGLYPLRGTPDVLATASPAAAVFAGTLAGVNNTVNHFKSAISGGRPSYLKNLIDEDNDPIGNSSTGYYQFRLLQRFLETYITVKKSAAGRDLRLAFCMWKDDAIYLVTPQQFEVRRDSSSPLEYLYSIVLKAFQRVRLDVTAPESPVYTPPIREPNVMAQILNTIQGFRATAQALKQIVDGVRGDINNVLEIAREVAYFCQDVINVAHAVIDLPKSVMQDLNHTIAQFASVRSNFDSLWQNIKSLPSSVEAEVNETGRIIDRIFHAFEEHGTVSGQADVQSGVAPNNSVADAINKILADPALAHPLLSKIQVSTLNISPAVQKKIQDESSRVHKFTRVDFETRRDVLVQLAVDLADLVGLGSLIYNQVYNRVPKTQIRVATSDDYDFLFSLNEMILALDKLASSSTINQNEVDKMEFFINTARQSGIDLENPVSKYAVPFPYHSTLERVALLYLNDANRWHEIAVLNNLRAPYVDEEGFDLPLLANGNGNTVVVGDATNLVIGQSVYLRSNNTSSTQRRIVSINSVSSSYVIVTLDGDPIDAYTLTQSATLHAYLPDTINSQSIVYIPSPSPVSPPDPRTKDVRGVNLYDPLLNIGGIDLLLTPKGDLAITPDGDCKLAVGYTNIIQTVRIGFSTPPNSLLQHPFFGFAIQPGESTADVDAKQILNAAKNLLSNDPMFSSVQSASVVKAGPVAQISITVGIAGSNQLLPLTFDIKR